MGKTRSELTAVIEDYYEIKEKFLNQANEFLDTFSPLADGEEEERLTKAVNLLMEESDNITQDKPWVDPAGGIHDPDEIDGPI